MSTGRGTWGQLRVGATVETHSVEEEVPDRSTIFVYSLNRPP